jgi:hypothetical protein
MHKNYIWSVPSLLLNTHQYLASSILIRLLRDNEIRRANNIRTTVEEVTKKSQRKHSSKSRSSSSKGKQKEQDNSNGEEGRAPALKGMLRHHSSASSSAKSDRSQLVDLVVEDKTAEDAERVRARKEGSAGWNSEEPKRFVYVHSARFGKRTNIGSSRTYGKSTGEDIREGYDPADSLAAVDGAADDEFIVGEDEEPEESRHWKQARESEEHLLKPKYGLEGEAFENVWSGGEPSGPPQENP